MSASTKNAADRLPPQTKFIVGNEACERFSYYGIRSILAGYITGEVVRGGLGQTTDTSTSIIHLFIFANYFMPLLGAWLSDKLVGRYYTILYVSLIYCLGNGVLACSDFFTTVTSKMICLAVGLGLVAFGAGGIKPCVSAFMGDQFKPEQGHLLQKAYGAFYWSINFGSFFSFLVVPWVKDHHGYGLAFGVPGVLMALATLIFWLGTKHYTRVPPARETKTAGFLQVFLHAFRSQGRMTLAPAINILAGLVLPMVTMIALTVVALGPTSASFSESDLKDFPRLVGKITQPADAVSACLGTNLSPDTVKALKETTDLSSAPAAVKAAVLHDLNKLVGEGVPLHEPQRFQGVSLRPATQELLARNPTGEDLVWLNRMLLEDAFPTELGKQPMVLAKTMKAIGWTALVGVAVWYLLILALSLLGRMELPDSFWQAARPRHSESEVSAARSVGPILFVFALVPIFWALFDQTTSTWVMQGQKMIPQGLLGYSVGAEQMQSANPALVMILVPLLTLVVYPRLGRLATPLRRMSAGFFLAAASYVIVAWLQQRLEAGAQLNVLWQTLPYIVLTTGEVLLSTTGLEFAFAESAASMRSTIMSFWLLTVALGNLIVTAITKVMGGGAAHAASVSTSRFLLYAGLTAVVGVLFSLVATQYRYRHPSFKGN
ncbi:MAG: MFS transporter [Verrucomicrobia bacterium]|nr:MFS transporter [Verrucomicrobiota bacterium]